MDIENLHRYFLNSTGISTDTRNIKKDSLFFALKGDNFNGNTFAQEALNKGAVKVIIDEEEYQTGSDEIILVWNSLTALQQLANYHRKYLGLPIIALTGSNGKTTTKELINAVLSKKFNTVATKGNLNNHIGVPLTLLSMDANTQIGIVEMGANHPKEIELLCQIALPDYGYITNFGKAHLEGFGSVEGVVKAKTELYQFLRENKKTVFVNADDPKQIETSQGIQNVLFGKEGSNCKIKLLDSSRKLLVGFKNIQIQSNLVGMYNFANISAAISIGHYFKVTDEAIKAGIEEYIPSSNRSQLLEKGTNSILLDAYNANPTSMLAAIENFKQSKGKNKMVILGDMFELGKETENEHQNIVNVLSENHFEKIFLVGSNFYNTKTENQNIYKLETFDSLRRELEKNPPTNKTILIKASRGMALERVLDLI